MKIEKATELKNVATCALIYAKPGMGKTTAIALEKGKKLIIDIDRSSDVLRSKENQESIKGLKEEIDNVDIVRVKSIKELDEIRKELPSTDYDIIGVDNLSELQDVILTGLAGEGHNPAVQHYLLMQSYIANFVREMRDTGISVILTAWETSVDRTNLDGSKYTQSYPQMNEKLADKVCGICNQVAHYEIVIKDKEETRGFRLSGNQSVYAKDQVHGRKGCKIGELIL
ncbi:MAG: AAA family ATPase [Clostridia bacterium]|jgi:phage nucleotide-binding protein|nr:AAA family ATPase [Clostridia bacterium]